MESFAWYGYIAWLPLVLWVLLYFWYLRCLNPLFLKKMVRKGHKWAVVPDYVAKDHSKASKLRLQKVLFSLVVILLSSCSVAWCFGTLHLCEPVFGFASAVIFIVFAVVLYNIAMGRISSIYQGAYFLEYRRVRFESEKKGAFQNEADVHNRTIWSFTKKLKNAEAHHRLWKYVNAMAKTKKIPPDVYAETMYV